MPCLDEAETLGTCIRKALAALQAHGVDGEVVVADNGSSDGSDRIALELGATLISVKPRGYGRAIMAGVEASRGTYVIMGDADDSYDFSDIPKFLVELRHGADLVQGCRLPSGGGSIRAGAMPPLHRYLGNPLLTFIARRLFSVPVSDIYCGMRGFSRAHYEELCLVQPGMEFATEMVVRSALRGGLIKEVPITLHPDGRSAHPPHLRTFRDGLRTLRLFAKLAGERNY